MLKKFIYSIIAAIVPLTAVAQNPELDIIPKPQQVKVNEGYFLLDENVAVKGNDPFSVNYLKEKIKNSTSITLLDEKANAQKVIGILKEKGYEVVTKVTPAGKFWVAEEYHQNYCQVHGIEPECHMRVKRF